MCHVKVTGGAGVVIGGAHICPFQPIFTFCFEPINISLPIGQPGEGGRGGNGTFCNGIIRLEKGQLLNFYQISSYLPKSGFILPILLYGLYGHI